jgi:hypothetical protein
MRPIAPTLLRRIPPGHTWPVLLMALYLVESLGMAYFADVSRDEGWYLYAGSAIRQGHLPYGDFPYFQSPLLPYLHAAIGSIVGTSLQTGRIISLLCGLLTASLVGLMASKLHGPWASVVALLGFVSSSYAVYHLNYAGNLASSTCLAFAAAYVLLSDRQQHLGWSVLAVGLAVLSCCVRLSFLPYAALLVGAAAWRHRASGVAVLALLLAGLAVGLTVMGWFLVFYPKQLWFNLVVAQAIRRSQFGASINQSVPSAWQ